MGRASLLLDWERRRFFEQLCAVRGSLDAALPLWLEESPAPPVSQAAPWTPAAVASLFHGWDSAWGRPPPPCGGFGTIACVEATTITGGLQLLVGSPLLAGPQLLAGMVGASWDLQAEGYQRGEGTDLVAPAELSPNGNRCPLRSIPCRPQGPPICTQSLARIVPPCTGGT